jgi:alpha-1,6-mannosyltransferase
MKIVDVCGFYSETGGGVRSYVLQKFEAALRHGHELVVVAPGAEDRVEPRPGGRIVWVGSPPMAFDPNYRMFLAAGPVWRVLEAEAPDMLEGSSPWRGGWIAGHWPGRAPRALVFHQDFVAGYPYTALRGLLSPALIDRIFTPYWRYVRRLSDRFDVTVAGGDWLADRLAGFGLKRPLAVPFGVESARFSPAHRDHSLRQSLLARCGLGPEGRLLLVVGRLHPEKRHATILKAFARARRSRPGIALAVIGDGLMRKSVEDLAAKVGGVALLGVITDRDLLARHYASADLLVHGSEAETYGLVVAEAIASGLAVVTTDLGGAADLARRGRSRTYGAGDVDACATAILAALRGELTAPTEPAAGSGEAHFDALFALYEGLVADVSDGKRRP